LSQPAVATANPWQDTAHSDLVWRRLPVSVSIDAEGKVVGVKVSKYEISDELARQLEQAVAAIRFTPGMRDGQAVPTVMETRLCFDAEGRLDTTPKSCWRAQTTLDR
jgi:hypothetical protein